MAEAKWGSQHLEEPKRTVRTLGKVFVPLQKVSDCRPLDENSCVAALQEGLRTLCVAYRRLSHSEYQEACLHLTQAKLALQDREQRLAQAYDIIEREFVLLGATAVEDR